MTSFDIKRGRSILGPPATELGDVQKDFVAVAYSGTRLDSGGPVDHRGGA